MGDLETVLVENQTKVISIFAQERMKIRMDARQGCGCRIKDQRIGT